MHTIFTPEALAKLAGQTCPFLDADGNVIGTATIQANGCAYVELNQLGLVRELSFRIGEGESYKAVDADTPVIVEGQP
jgi:hypothetical protein